MPPADGVVRLAGQTEVQQVGRAVRRENRRCSERAVAAAVPPSTCCHTFRATGITAYLSNGGTLEHTQQIAGHASPKTTKLYDPDGRHSDGRRDRAHRDLERGRSLRFPAKDAGHMFARLRHVFEDRRTCSATPCGAGRGSTACLRALTERQTTTAAGCLVFDTSSRRWPDFERGARRPPLRAAWTSTWTSSGLEGAPLPRHERNPNASGCMAVDRQGPGHDQSAWATSPTPTSGTSPASRTT